MMEVYTPGSIAALLSSSGSKKKKSVATTPETVTLTKSVKFERNSDDKKHKKFVKTPFSRTGKKKEKLHQNESEPIKPEKSKKRKLVFDEAEVREDSKPRKKKKSKKPIVNEQEDANNILESEKLNESENFNESSDVNLEENPKVKKHRKSKKSKKLIVNEQEDANNILESENVNESPDVNLEENPKVKKHRKSKKSKKLIVNEQEDANNILESEKLNESENVNESPDVNIEENPKVEKHRKKKKSKKAENQEMTISNGGSTKLEESKKPDNIFIKSTNDEVQEKDFNNTENTVFVGNIPITYSKIKVLKIFNKFGPVKNVRIRCAPVAKLGASKKAAVCLKEFHPNRKSLAAFVVYNTEEGVKAAIAQNGMIADGHHLRIDSAENERKEFDTNKAIFIGGLPFDVEDDELWEFFEKCGEIESVRVIRDKDTSMGKGFGYVNFKSSASVELALELDWLQIRKRKINVKRCTKIKKKNKFNRGENLTPMRNKNNFNKSIKKPRKSKFNLHEKKVTAKQVGSLSSFQGKKMDSDKKKKKKHKLNKNEAKKKKFQKILAT